MQNQDPKPQFRNTRSRFFKKKPNDPNASFQVSSEGKTGDDWKKKGNQMFGKRKFLEAIQCYTKAIEMNEGESIYYSNRARCHKQLGDYKKALLDATTACELDDMNIKANYLCGCVLAQLGKTQPSKLPKANNRLKKALRLCSTLKKSEFTDDISIKLFRLKKLCYMIEEQKRKHRLSLFEAMLTENNNKEILEQVQKQKEELNQPKEIPDFMLCKITLEIMEDPVTTESGFSYQKSAIQDHFMTNGSTDPLSRKKISNKLYPNQGLKAAIRNFLEANPWAYEYTPDEQFSQIVF